MVGGGVCCWLVLLADRSAPSARGEGKPPPPLEEGGESAGSMAGWGPLSLGGERERCPHTSGVSS
jgi:hypothetical protein